VDQLPAWVTDVLGYSWVRAALIVAGSVVAAKIVDFFITRAVMRLAKRTRGDYDDEIVKALHRPIFVSVLLVGVYIAELQMDWPPTVDRGISGLIQTIAIVLWTIAVLRVVSTLLRGVGKLGERVSWIDARTVPLFDNLAKIVFVGGALYFLLLAWNLNVSAWLASAGIMGLALGLAAQDTLANFFGGLSIIADAPYKIGDFINLDSGERGEVTRIGLRSTRLLTRDDVEVTLPNSVMANAKIINENAGRWRKMRVTVVAGVAYGSDVDQVREVLMTAARSVEHVLDDPEPRIRFTEMADSALVFRVQCWIADPVLRGQCTDQLNTAIYKALNAAAITIPFPQRDVHLIPQP